MDNFSLKKWMFENKVTKQSALINEVVSKDANPKFDRKNYRAPKQPGVETDRERFAPNNGDFSKFDMKTQYVDADDMDAYTDWILKMNEESISNDIVKERSGDKRKGYRMTPAEHSFRIKWKGEMDDLQDLILDAGEDTLGWKMNRADDSNTEFAIPSPIMGHRSPMGYFEVQHNPRFINLVTNLKDAFMDPLGIRKGYLNKFIDAFQAEYDKALGVNESEDSIERGSLEKVSMSKKSDKEADQLTDKYDLTDDQAQSHVDLYNAMVDM